MHMRTLYAGIVGSSVALGLLGLGACVGEDTGADSSNTVAPDSSANESASGGGGDAPNNNEDAQAAKDTNSDSDSDDGDTGSNPTPDPSTIAGAALQLWLNAEKGLTCNAATPSRVTAWTDQSAKGHNATPVAVGPQCNTVNFNGKFVVELTKPVDTTAPKDDETLTVDLSYLVDASYTILVVERAQGVGADNRAGILGTIIPGESTSPPGNVAIHLGYEYGAPPNLTFDQHYSACGSTQVTLPMATPAVTTAWFDKAVGHRLYRNGALVADVTTNKAPLTSASNGAIGRSFFKNASDSRYWGAIAEVIIYTTALSDMDRMKLETYAKTHWGITF